MAVSLFQSLRCFELEDIVRCPNCLLDPDDPSLLSPFSLSSLSLHWWVHIFYLTQRGERKRDPNPYYHSYEMSKVSTAANVLSMIYAKEEIERKASLPYARRTRHLAPSTVPLSTSSCSPSVLLPSYSETQKYVQEGALLPPISLPMLVHCKRVRWLPEDKWSNLKQVASRIDAVQYQQWKWWRKWRLRKRGEEGGAEENSSSSSMGMEKDTISSFSSSATQDCTNFRVPSSALRDVSDTTCSLPASPFILPPLEQIREAMVIYGHLLPYYALHSLNKDDILPASHNACPVLLLASTAHCGLGNSSACLPCIPPEAGEPTHEEAGNENDILSADNIPLFRSLHHAWLLEPCMGSVESLLSYSAIINSSDSSSESQRCLQPLREKWLVSSPVSGKEEDAVAEASLSVSLRRDDIRAPSSHSFACYHLKIPCGFASGSCSRNDSRGLEKRDYLWSLQYMLLDIITALEVLHHRCDIAHGDVSLSNILWTLHPEQALEKTLSRDTASPAIPATNALQNPGRIHFLLGDLETLYPLSEAIKPKAGNHSAQREEENAIPLGMARVSHLKGMGEEQERELPYQERCMTTTPDSGFRGALLYAPLEHIVGGGGNEFALSDSLPPASAAGDVWSLGMVLLQILLIQNFTKDVKAKTQDGTHQPKKKMVKSLLQLHPFALGQHRTVLSPSLASHSHSTCECQGSGPASHLSLMLDENRESTVFDIIFYLQKFKQECSFYEEEMSQRNSTGDSQGEFRVVERALMNMYREDDLLFGVPISHSFIRDNNTISTEPPRGLTLNFLARCLHPDPNRRATIQDLKELVINNELLVEQKSTFGRGNAENQELTTSLSSSSEQLPASASSLSSAKISPCSDSGEKELRISVGSSKNESSEVFLDVCPKVFERVLNFLRTKVLFLPTDDISLRGDLVHQLREWELLDKAFPSTPEEPLRDSLLSCNGTDVNSDPFHLSKNDGKMEDLESNVSLEHPLPDVCTVQMLDSMSVDAGVRRHALTITFGTDGFHLRELAKRIRSDLRELLSATYWQVHQTGERSVFFATTRVADGAAALLTTSILQQVITHTENMGYALTSTSSTISPDPVHVSVRLLLQQFVFRRSRLHLLEPGDMQNEEERRTLLQMYAAQERNPGPCQESEDVEETFNNFEPRHVGPKKTIWSPYNGGGDTARGVPFAPDDRERCLDFFNDSTETGFPKTKK